MNRRRRRNIILLSLLLILLLLLVAWYIRYLRTRDLGIPRIRAAQARLSPPQYLYSIVGEGAAAMRAPLGVAVARDGRVYVTDSREGVGGRMEVYTTPGQFLFEFKNIDKGKVRENWPTIQLPVYVAINPVTRNVYVTDRGRSSLYVFTPEGGFVQEIVPSKKKDFQWKPNAMGFASDGTLYVSDLFFQHQVWIFDPAGRVVKRFGKSGRELSNLNDQPGSFWFPNGIAVANSKDVYVADSDNRRIQVFSPDGAFKSVQGTTGHPRGLVFWRGGPVERLIMVDTLANFMTVYDLQGRELVQFGTRGQGLGQFLYPNGIDVGPDRKIFITDRQNDRVQVWGWGAELPAINLPPGLVGPIACLAPLLLLPLLWFARRRRFFACDDWLALMVENEKLQLMTGRKVFTVLEETHEEFKDIRQDELLLGDLLETEPHSATDVRDLMDRYEIGEREAIILSIARRKHALLTEDTELRRLAITLDIKVLDYEQYVEEYEKASSD
jgi:DNA-binding beta-propeller fold protein YncE